MTGEFASRPPGFSDMVEQCRCWMVVMESGRGHLTESFINHGGVCEVRPLAAQRLPPIRDSPPPVEPGGRASWPPCRPAECRPPFATSADDGRRLHCWAAAHRSRGRRRPAVVWSRGDWLDSLPACVGGYSGENTCCSRHTRCDGRVRSRTPFSVGALSRLWRLPTEQGKNKKKPRGCNPWAFWSLRSLTFS